MSNSFNRLLVDTRTVTDMVDLYQLTGELTWVYIAPMPEASDFADKADYSKQLRQWLFEQHSRFQEVAGELANLAFRASLGRKTALQDTLLADSRKAAEIHDRLVEFVDRLIEIDVTAMLKEVQDA